MGDFHSYTNCNYNGVVTVNLEKLELEELVEKLAKAETRISEMIQLSVRLKYELQKRIVENGITGGV